VLLFFCCEVARSLDGRIFCSVSPARYAGSSLTCAEHSAAQAPYPFALPVHCLGVRGQVGIYRPPLVKYETAALVM